MNPSPCFGSKALATGPQGSPSLAAFSICSLCLTFVSLINMCLGVFLFGFILYGLSGFLVLAGYFLSHFREVLFIISSNTFLYPFLFSSSVIPMIQMLLHLILSRRLSLRLSSLLYCFFFILLCVLCVFNMKKEDLVKSNIGSFQRQVLLRMVGIKLKLLVLLACVTLKNIIQLYWVKRICSIPKKIKFSHLLWKRKK